MAARPLETAVALDGDLPDQRNFGGAWAEQVRRSPTVAALGGAASWDDAADLVRHLLELVASEDDTVELDLTGLARLDEQWRTVLVAVAKHQVARGRILRVRVTPQVESTLKTLGLHPMLDFVEAPVVAGADHVDGV
jgi:ABC-type transporter Mla MlaB component